MSQPQSASLANQNSHCTVNVSTPRSSGTFKNNHDDPSIIFPPACKLKNLEFNSSASLLAKMEALKNETFAEPKALQVNLNYLKQFFFNN